MVLNQVFSIIAYYIKHQDLYIITVHKMYVYYIRPLYTNYI
jgi:hypothetical protein